MLLSNPVKKVRITDNAYCGQVHDRQSSSFWSDPGLKKVVIADKARKTKIDCKTENLCLEEGHKCMIVSPQHFGPILGMSTMFKSVVH